MLIFVFLTIFLQRDYGPMLRAERRARSTGQLVRPGGHPMASERLTKIGPKPGIKPRAARAVIPILVILLVTLLVIWIDGNGPFPKKAPGSSGLAAWKFWEWTWPQLNTAWLREILYAGAGARPILYGSFSGFVVALFLSFSFSLRVGLVLGWILAAAVTTPASELLLSTLSERLAAVADAAGAEPTLTQLVARYVLTALETSLGGAMPYVVFLALFLVCSATLGFLAKTLFDSDDDPQSAAPPQTLSATEATRAAISSTHALLLAFAILFLAWMIGAACTQMGTASYLVAQVSGQLGKVYWILPIALFLISCLVSFSTGSSWSTMGILLPIIVALAWQVGESSPETTGMALLILSIGAVLEGSIFGDHCSPISDTTVLSSVACASDHIDHVRTQAPYAIVVAAIALLVGYLPQVLNLCPWWLSFAIGISAMTAILLVFGRNPNRVVPQPMTEPSQKMEPGDAQPFVVQ